VSLALDAQLPAHGKTRVAVLSPGDTATHSIFYALCVLGLPSTHWDEECSTQSPMLDTETPCVFAGSAIPTIPEEARFPPAAQLKELAWVATANVCLDASVSESELPETCQIGNWMAAYLEAAKDWHVANTSAADNPFHYPTLYTWKELRPASSQPEDEWLFIYSHRDAQEWAATRIRNHGFGVLCNPQDAKLAALASEDISPYDVPGCLRYCLRQEVATKDDTLRSCLTTEINAGVDAVAAAFEQHTQVALKTAPAPVLQMRLLNRPEELSDIELAAKVRTFAKRNGHTMPCEHGVDAKQEQRNSRLNAPLLFAADKHGVKNRSMTA